MPARARITDVSPRDGLQNEPGRVPTDDKLRLIALLAAAGVDEVEATSFVSPKWIPQLGDAADLVARLARSEFDGTDAPLAPLRERSVELCAFSALVPNERGMQDLLAANTRPDDPTAPGPIGKASVFTAATETFCRKNINATIAESIERFEPVIASAQDAGLLVRGYVSCVIACPFEGPVAPILVARVVESLLSAGVNEIDLGDTIGAGDAHSTGAVLRAVREATRGHRDPFFGEDFLTWHAHDTFGRAGACVRAAIDLGVVSFDGAVAGLGGCPYASTPGKRAPGNVSTELVVRVCREAGLEVGVDDAALARAGAFAAEAVAKARQGAA